MKIQKCVPLQKKAIKSAFVLFLVISSLLFSLQSKQAFAGEAETKITITCTIANFGNPKAITACIAAALAVKEIDTCLKFPQNVRNISQILRIFEIFRGLYFVYKALK